MRGRQQLFFGLQLVNEEFQHLAIQNKILQSFGWLSNKIAPANRKKGFYSIQTVILTSKSLIHVCIKRLRTLKSFQIFSPEIEKSKNYSGSCPFEGLSNGTTLMQIKSGRTIPLLSRFHNNLKLKFFSSFFIRFILLCGHLSKMTAGAWPLQPLPGDVLGGGLQRRHAWQRRLSAVEDLPQGGAEGPHVRSQARLDPDCEKRIT